MLEFELAVPDNVQNGAMLIVVQHGRGGDKQSLMGLRPRLPATAIVVTSQAPFPADAWGYGAGWAWYRYLGGTTPEPESFEMGQQRLDEFLRALPEHLPVTPGRLVLGGFSQGATTSLAYALRHPGEVSGVIVLSGFLASHPSVRVAAETVQGTRIFWGHGTEDAAIPFAYASEGRAKLRAAGADVTIRDYPIDHRIVVEEMADVLTWLEGEEVPAAAAT